jgi:general secretion pathway protein K
MTKRLSMRFGRGERGFALLLVLWGLILLALIAASFMRETRVDAVLARNVVENAKAEALAQAGVERAILSLLDPDPATAWRVDGRSYRFALGEGTIDVRIQDEGGKIDVNHAAPDMLTALFQAAGADSEAAIGLTDAVLDYVDQDGDRRPAGAEDPEYAAAGSKGGAKDAPFERKEELMNVLGMTRAVYDAIAADLTVYSDQSDINPLTASERVLRLIPNLTGPQIDQIVAARQGHGPEELPRVDVVTIIASGRTSGGGHFVREAVARRSDQPDRPFLFLDWRQTWEASH